MVIFELCGKVTLIYSVCYLSVAPEISIIIISCPLWFIKFVMWN